MPPKNAAISSRPEALIMHLLRSEHRCTIKNLFQRLPDFSWSQLFLALDALSRRGEIILSHRGFTYEVCRAKDQAVLDGAFSETTHSDR